MKVTLIKITLQFAQILFVSLITFWILLFVTFARVLAAGGREKLRGYILHITDSHSLFAYSPSDPAQSIETAYQVFFVLLALTWGLRELTRILHRRSFQFQTLNEQKTDGS